MRLFGSLVRDDFDPEDSDVDAAFAEADGDHL